MKKRRLFGIATLIGISAICLAGAACLSACGGSDKQVNVNDYLDEYGWHYQQAFVGEKDADMKIDGVLDEARWKEEGKQWLTHSEKNVKMSYTTAFTEKGLYIAATAEDPHMQWNERRKFNSNSSFRFYIVSNTATQQFCFDCMSFYVDEQNSASRQQVRFDAKAKRGVSEGGTPTLTAEFFASWKDLGYTVDEESGMPEAVYMVPMYRYVEGMDSAGNTFLKPIFAEIDNDRIHNNFAFGKEGYLNADKEDAELGNAGNGFAKSDGWDLSDLDGGEDGVKTVRSTGEHGQAIFFKGINSSRYSYSVDIKINRGTVDDNITAGVCDMKDATQINILRYSGNDYNNNGKTGYRYFLFDFYVTPWHDIQQGVYDGEPSDTVIFRVIKDDTKYYYIFNGEYEFSTNIDWLGGKTCPGLWALSTEAVFSNWEVTDFEGADKDDAYKKELEKYVHAINISSDISGGTVTADKIAVTAGGNEEVKLNVRPSRGYMLTDITVNGVSKYDEYVENLQNGVIKLSGISETLNIDATFSPLPASATLRLTGTIVRTSGTPVVGLPYTTSCSGEWSELLSVNGSTTTAGVFDIVLLRSGTYEIGGRSVTTDGKYTLAFEGTFGAGENNEIQIDTSDAKFDGQTYFRMESMTLNPYRVSNMKQNPDKSVQTTHTKYTGLEDSYFIYNETIEGSFSMSTTILAPLDNWPCAGITIEDELGDSVQFYVASNTFYRIRTNYGAFEQKHGILAFENGVCDFCVVYDETEETFTLYAHGEPFYSIPKAGLLTGSRFTVGVTAYMSGADGASGTIDDENPFVKFTDIAIDQSYTVTAPQGVKISVNGTEITDGKVPVRANVTVTVPAEGNILYNIFVNGKAVAAEKANGVVSATFVATENCDITCVQACEVNGTVKVDATQYPDLANTVVLSKVAVIVRDANGGVAYKGAVNAEGEFTAALADGTYYITAMADSMVSGKQEITIANGEVSGKAEVTLSKPRVAASDLFTTEYQFDGAYSSQVIDERIGGYFAGVKVAQSDAFVLTATITNMGTGAWTSAGFMTSTNDRWLRFVFRKNGDHNNYDIVLFRSYGNAIVASIGDETLANTPWEGKTELDLVLAYAGNGYSFFVDGVLVFATQESVGAGQKQIGLFNEHQLTYTDWGYSTDMDVISEYIGATVTGDDITVKVNGETRADGKVLVGEEVTVSVSVENENSTVLINGNAVTTTVANNIATATFTVNKAGSYAVTVTQSYAVSGTTTAGATVTVVNAEGIMAGETTADAQGSFSLLLPNGTYYVTATTDTLASSAVAVSVNGAAVENVTATPNKPILVAETGWAEILYNRVTGSLTVVGENMNNNGGYFKGVSVENNGAFVIKATVEKFDGNWYSAGFAVKIDGGNYRFVFRKNNNGKYDSVIFPPEGMGAPDINTTHLLDNPFADADTIDIALVYRNGTYYLFAGDTCIHTYKKSNGMGAVQIGLFCEQNVSYTDWGYTTEADDVFSYLGATVTGEDVTVKVGNETRTDGKVYLGEEVTISMSVPVGADYTLVVNGSSVTTATENGVATATFTVSGTRSIVVTYSASYAVSGTTEAGATVTFISERGVKAGEVTADENGAFSLKLSDGKYVVTAQTDSLVSGAVAVSVNGAAVENVTVTPNKPKFAANGNIAYDAATGKAVSSVQDNYAYFVNGTVANGAAFAVTATVEKFDNAWRSAGFVVKIGEKTYRFVMRKAGVEGVNGACYDMVAWHSATDQPAMPNDEFKTNPFTQDGNTANLALVYSGGKYYFFINNVLCHTVTEADEGARQLGLFCEQAGVVYADWGYTTDFDTLYGYIGTTVTGEGVTVKVGDDTRSDGKVLMGEEVTVSVSVTDPNSKLTVNGEAVQTSITEGVASATISITAKGAYTVGVSVAALSVSGTTTAGATVIVSSQSGAEAGRATADAQGNWSVTLAAGTYTVIAETATHISISQNIEIAEASVTGVDITPNKLKLAAGDVKFNAATGKASSSKDHENLVGFVGATVNGAFAITATVEKFEIDWQSAGFLVASGDKWLRFTFRKNGEGTKPYDIVLFRSTGNPIVVTVENEELRTNPFAKKTTIDLSLVYSSNTYYLIANGVIIYTSTESIGGTQALGLFCEQKAGSPIVYTQWDYSTDFDVLHSLIGATVTGDGVTVKVGDDTRADGKVLLGEQVTVSMNVPEGATYNLSVAGNSVSTTTENGVATATFTVTKTGALAVTYDAAYSVSGTTTAGATVTVVTGNGTVSGTAVADGEGKFSLTLTNGTYYLTAATDTFVSGAVEVTVNGAAVENKTVTPTKAKLIAGGSINYNLVTGNAVSNGAAQNGADFTGATFAEGTDFVLTATVEKFDGVWYSAGFATVMNDGWFRFVFRKNGETGLYDIVMFQSYGTAVVTPISDSEIASKPFGEGDAVSSVRLALVRKGNNYYLFVNDVLVYTANNPGGTNVNSVGLFCERQITYTDWGYSTDISGYEIPTA